MDASELRKQLQQRQREVSDRLRVLKQHRALIRGKVYKLRELIRRQRYRTRVAFARGPPL